MSLFQQRVLIAALAAGLLLIFVAAAINIDRDKTVALTDPNLPTIRYIGREHADDRFRFQDYESEKRHQPQGDTRQ